jgi:chaperonin GroEL (HSP60 family)
VTRTAPRNAASIAGLLLTIEAVVTEKPCGRIGQTSVQARYW